MAAPRVTIDTLPEKTALAGTEWFVVQDGVTSKKVSATHVGSGTGGGGGSGVPNGGTTGQVLGKLSNTNGDAGWLNPIPGPAGPAGPAGAQGNTGAAGGGAQQALWTWVPTAVSSVQAAGRIGVNTDNLDLATQVWISKFGSADGIDWSVAIQAMANGDHIYFQARADAASFHRYLVTGAAVANGTNWVVPVTNDTGSPAGTEPTNGADVLVAFQYQSTGLTAASNAETIAGVLTTKAVTPASLAAALVGKVVSTTITTIWSGTQAAYDAIPTKDPATLYFVV